MKGDIDAGDIGASVIAVAISLGAFLITLLKGKPLVAVIGLFVPIVQLWGAIPLARPESWWARRRYPAGSKKLARAEARDARWTRRRLRGRDALGGAPHLERTTRE